jgi:hypothetical protein
MHQQLPSRHASAHASDSSHTEQRFVYGFSVWPDETWTFDQAVYRVFEIMSSRVELDFSESEFERFRSGLSHHGLTLREVERVPYIEPEAIP